MVKSYLYSILFITCLFHSHYANSASLNVAVAANFKHTLSELKPVFEKQSGHSINIISASTGQLVQQILHGAPFDVLLAANTEHPEILWQNIQKTRQLPKSALMHYAKGRLVFFSLSPFTQEQNIQQILRYPKLTRISIANPKLAPYGLAAKQTLECLGLYDQWKASLITGQNIAQAFQFIDSQSVDAGFVALSQVINRGANHILEIDSRCYDDIVQGALRLNNKKHSMAFMSFLNSPTAITIIEKNGYLIP